MLKFDDLLKNRGTLGIALGVGAAIAAVALVPNIPFVARSTRPAARAALKSGLVFFERGREILAEAHEELEDMLAEVRAELQLERNVKEADIDNSHVMDTFRDKQP